MRRLPTDDWKHVGWHYKAIHRFGGPWHNRLWIRAKGLDHFPTEDGFVIASNHSSWWDAIPMQATLGRPISYLVKRELMATRFTNWFFGRGGAIPVDRDKRNPHALDAAVDALRDRRVIGIFPEGTRHVGELGRAKTGVARIALAADARVVPVGVLTDRFWPCKSKLPNLREKLLLNVGKPMRLEGDPTDPAIARRETDRVMAAVGELLDEARQAREAGEKWSAP